jgi:hypothetical protein
LVDGQDRLGALLLKGFERNASQLAPAEIGLENTRLKSGLGTQFTVDCGKQGRLNAASGRSQQQFHVERRITAWALNLQV